MLDFSCADGAYHVRFGLYAPPIEHLADVVRVRFDHYQVGTWHNRVSFPKRPSE
jgi:hypothetical protein